MRTCYIKGKTNGKISIDKLPFVLYNYIRLKRKEMNLMNVRMLKAKRVERNLRQKDLANALGITEKAMCHKECCIENKFKAAEMLTLVDELELSFAEFDTIFFDQELTKRLRRTVQIQPSGK